jgi:hypothetical protein
LSIEYLQGLEDFRISSKFLKKKKKLVMDRTSGLSLLDANKEGWLVED